MERLAHKLLPLLLALVAGLLLATGIRGFRAEHPSLPAALGRLTTPFVTEAPAIDVTLPDGTRAQLKPGAADYDLAEFLASNSTERRAFQFAGDPGTGAAAPADWQRIAAILALHPDAKIAIEGPAASGLQAYLQQAGVAAVSGTAPADADDADATPEAASAGPVRLIVNPDAASQP